MECARDSQGSDSDGGRGESSGIDRGFIYLVVCAYLISIYPRTVRTAPVWAVLLANVCGAVCGRREQRMQYGYSARSARDENLRPWSRQTPDRHAFKRFVLERGSRQLITKPSITRLSALIRYSYHTYMQIHRLDTNAMRHGAIRAHI